ncbi:MAG: hypothetical protein AABY04_02880 [Candidatus Micrarchaeota archaeon]
MENVILENGKRGRKFENYPLLIKPGEIAEEEESFLTENRFDFLLGSTTERLRASIYNDLAEK